MQISLDNPSFQIYNRHCQYEIKERKIIMTRSKQSLYDPSFEHDNCGIGAVVNIKGIKSHKTVADALGEGGIFY